MSSVSSSSGGNSYYYAMQKKMFEKMDTDEDGSLNRDEVLSGKPKAMTKDQASALYDTLDADKSGSVSLDEFAAGTKSGAGVSLIGQLPSDALDVLLQLQQQAGLAASGGGTGGSGSGSQTSSDAAYDVLDTNKDGVVSEDEFLAAHPGQLSDAQAKKLFETMDADHDGNIDKDQFQQITNATTPPRLMGPDYFGIDAQTGQPASNDSGSLLGGSSSFGGMASLFGSASGGPNSAYHLFDLLEQESETTTSSV